MDQEKNQDMNDAMEGKYIPVTSIKSGVGHEVQPDVYAFTDQIVNVIFIGSSDQWVLVDTGMPESTGKILDATANHFGEDSKPKAIILTHGHFDHVGTCVDLVEKWQVPVYAHEMEMPFLTGRENYPEPDGSVEGGLVAKMSPMFPNQGIDLGSHAKPLPEDGRVPEMEGWRWVHTPGHSPGHISLYRESDGTLIAGDAFITVEQESLLEVLTQKKEIHGPPRYLTTDWEAARESVKELEALHPEVAVCGHGLPMSGKELEEGLTTLVNHFDSIAIPDYGRWVDEKK